MKSIALTLSHSEKNSNKKNQNLENQGGYVAILHSLEEKFYGPDSPIDPKGKIMLCIRHLTLRNWTKRRKISKKEIEKATGLDRRIIEKNLKVLEEEKIILIHRSKTGKAWNENEYELHPETFGTDFLYRKNQTFSVIEGGKKEEKPEDPEEGGVPSSDSVNHRPHQRVEEELSSGNQKEKPPLKNPYKEPLQKDPSEIVDKKNWNEVKKEILKSYPRDEKILEQAFHYLQNEGYHGKKISFPSAYLLNCWSQIRSEFLSPYSSGKEKREEKPEEEISSPETAVYYLSQFKEKIRPVKIQKIGIQFSSDQIISDILNTVRQGYEKL